MITERIFFPPELFLKACTIAEDGIAEDGVVRFTHLKKKFCLTSPCFRGRLGQTILIDTGLSVFREDKKIGNAEAVK